MNIRNISIRTRLTIGFAFIILMLAFLGYTALNDISEVTKATENIYNHPLTVSNAVRDINANIIAIHRSMKDVALAQDDIEMNRARLLVDQYENAVFEKFEIVFSQFLGDMQDVENAHKSFSDWKEIREEVILLWSKGKKDDAISITKGKGADHVQKVLDDVQVMIDFASLKAEEFYENTKKNEINAYNRMIMLISLLVVISSLIIILLSRSIILPINEMNTTAKRIESGDIEARNLTRSKDELNALAVSFNNMTDAIKSRNTTLSGLADISTSLHGLDDLEEFISAILSKFIELTGCQLATFFILDTESNKFTPIKAIGASIDQFQPFNSESAPGDFGHVLDKKSVYILRDIKDENYFQFSSVVGKLYLKEVVSIPVISQNNVQAIISFGVLNRFSSDSIDIFVQSQQIISASFSTLLANLKTQEFSAKLSKTNEALKMQSEELKEQAQELRNQSAELKITSDNLHEQNIELELQRREVEEANKLKSEFLSNMSHELRTPLNSINALSKVLTMQASDKLNEDESSYLKIIERNGKRLLSLINDILDLSKVEAGKMDIRLKSFSLNNALFSAIENVQSLADEKEIEIKFHSGDNINIESDEGRLYQVITNIIGNAIKFTEEGEINIYCKKENNVITIKVQDTGIGIHEDVLPYIFNEFRQADGTTTRRYEGTGLGLAIANKIIKALHGNITCESRTGIGSIFTITLPVNWDIQIPQPKNPTKTYNISNSDKTILVVDDDKTFIDELAAKIKTEGFEVMNAMSGKEAIEMAIAYKPFAITLDIVMPEMDGWEVLQNLKANSITSDIPVIIVSSSDESETSVALGAVGYIQKPIDRIELIREIHKVKGNAKKIMVTDDNEVDIINVENILSDDRYEIISCNSGVECLELLKTQTPDILILDLMMPGMDGFQVLSEIRQHEQLSKLPVIIVTAKDLNAKEKLFLNEKATSIITKEKTADSLVEEVHNILLQLDNSTLSSKLKQRPNILIIEDNETAIIQIKKVLETEGLHVNHVTNGEDAMEYMKSSIPEGIILDLMMPGMDGFQVLNNIRGNEFTKDIPVLVLTAKTLTSEDLIRLESNNIKQLIQKGDVDMNQLKQSVNEMLGKTKNNKVEEIKKKDIRKKNAKEDKPTILIIEDNRDNITTIKAILGKRYITLEAEDGELGYEMIKNEKPDLVLLDISLPGKDGFEIVKLVRENDMISNTPVIAVTAKAMKDDKEKIIASGCNAYISKPIDDDELRTLITSFLS